MIKKDKNLKIAYLGAGTWAYCLASLLASKGYEVTVWVSNPKIAKSLRETGQHPNLPGLIPEPSMRFTENMEEAVMNADLIAEGVTSAGIRPVFEKLKKIKNAPSCPIVLTSKGIEQNSGLLLSEVVMEVLGMQSRSRIGCLSGPSHAEEVIKKMPTSVVCSAYDLQVMEFIQKAFATSHFRVYRNADINGVEFGGAMKNIIAIAAGISDGLGYGDNTKAALMTRGLFEIRKLCITKGCHTETLNGLSGLGDLCVTCLSNFSRNYRFGALLAKGMDPELAKQEIGVVVEGAYTCVSALQLAKNAHIELPITQAIYEIIYERKKPSDCVKNLMKRPIKEEYV